MIKTSSIFVGCLCVRVALALILRTSFAPDEFWQGPEVAHRMVFGYGHLTWEWAAGLRSYLHPSIYALLYFILRTLHLDTPFLIAKGPQLFQAIFAAITDVSVYKISLFMHGVHVARWTLICQLTSWFNAYALIRTYSSSVEAALTALGLVWLLIDIESIEKIKRTTTSTPNRKTNPSMHYSGLHRARAMWMLAAALSVAVRPPSGIFWGVVALYVVKLCPNLYFKCRVMLQGLFLGGVICALCVALDLVFYNRLVIAPYNFFMFNIFQGGSGMYGVNPWHWNFTCNMPSMLASFLPLLAVGLRYSIKEQLSSTTGLTTSSLIALLAFLQMLVYSVSSHKEHRFLLPSMQLWMPFCGLGAALLSFPSNVLISKKRVAMNRSNSDTNINDTMTAPSLAAVGNNNNNNNKSTSPVLSHPLQSLSTRRNVLVRLCIGLQIPLILFFGIFHQQAQIGIMHSITRELSENNNNNNEIKQSASVLFLTPCHTTPYYSYIHRNISMRFLDCSPPGWSEAVEELNKAGFDWLQLPKASMFVKNTKDGVYNNDTVSQRQAFEANPAEYLKSIFKLNSRSIRNRKASTMPQLIVGYTQLMARNDISYVLRGRYERASVLNNCWVQTDDDNECSIEVWRRK